MSIGKLPESLRQAMVVGTMLVGGLDVDIRARTKVVLVKVVS